MTQTHKKHVFHLRRVGLFGILFAAFFIVRADAGALPEPLEYSGKVLAYASEMSRGGLLSGTNAARSANGLAPLSLHSQLNNSAQAKAQDMANKNYWAHVSPDGTEPWYFFDQAGYSYVRAGENLAYGFMTSQGVIDGWMNSASHRANILGDYYDVGFGIVNTPDYQSSGEQTIVVAHYGTQAMAPAPPPPAAPAESSPPPAAPITPVVEPTPAPAAPAAPAPNPSTPAPVATPEKTTEEPPAQTPASAPIVQTGNSSQVSVLGMIATRTLPIAALTSLMMLSIAVTGYALTHRAAFQHTVTTGEHFVATHPGVDAGIIAAVTALILLTSYGNIG